MRFYQPRIYTWFRTQRLISRNVFIRDLAPKVLMFFNLNLVRSLHLEMNSDRLFRSVRWSACKMASFSARQRLQRLAPLLNLFFVLFAIFILHSRESELYRYTLDGKSALAWELPFSRFLWATCLPHKGGGVPLSALPKDTTSELAGLFSTMQPLCI